MVNQGGNVKGASMPNYGLVSTVILPQLILMCRWAYFRIASDVFRMFPEPPGQPHSSVYLQLQEDAISHCAVHL